MKTTKMTKKTIKTRNILIISHRFDDIDWKYLRISECASSTFVSVSSTLESILQQIIQIVNIYLKYLVLIISASSVIVIIAMISRPSILLTVFFHPLALLIKIIYLSPVFFQ